MQGLSAHVSIRGDETDWFGGECEFPVLPPIGSTINVRDRYSNMRRLTVVDLVIKGVPISAKHEPFGNLDRQWISIVCSEI